jgi:AcrR family transcriptional regulator
MQQPAVVMGNLPEQEKQAINRFFAAAEPLFVRLGYRRTTVEEICRAAGASTRTFYDHFENKAHLFTRLGGAIARQMVETWQGKQDTTRSSSARLADFLRTYVHLRRERALMNLFFDELENIHELRGYAARSYRECPLVGVARALVRQGQRRGEFQPADPEHATLLLMSTVNTSLFFLPRQHHRLEERAEEEMMEATIAFVVRGLGGSPDE